MKLKDLEKLRKKNGYIDISQSFKNIDCNEKFLLEDGNIFWKSNFNDGYSNFTEVLVSILCRQIDFPCAKYELAQNETELGVISYDLENGGLKTILYNDFLNSHKEPQMKKALWSISIQDFYSILQAKLKQGEITKENANILLKDHVKLMIFDSIIGNSDRHTKNLLILTDQKQFKLSPAFDNELAFMSHFSRDRIANCLKNDNLKGIVKKQVYNVNGAVVMFNKNSCITNYLTNLSETKKAFPKLFDDTLKQMLKMDIDKAFAVVEEEQKVTLPNEYKNWINFVHKERTNSIKEYFKKNNNIETQKDDLQL